MSTKLTSTPINPQAEWAPVAFQHSLAVNYILQTVNIHIPWRTGECQRLDMRPSGLAQIVQVMHHASQPAAQQVMPTSSLVYERNV